MLVVRIFVCKAVHFNIFILWMISNNTPVGGLGSLQGRPYIPENQIYQKINHTEKPGNTMQYINQIMALFV